MFHKNLIHITGKVIIIVLFTILELPVHSFNPPKDDSLRFEVILNKKMLNEIHLDINFIESLEITPARLIMLSSINKFYLLGMGGIQAVGQKDAGTISSFAYTPDGFLMVARNKELCYIDSLGNFAKLFNLPGPNMKISAGKDVMYIYDRTKNQKKYALYGLAKGGNFDTLLVVPSLIMCVAEMNQSVLFSMENAVFSFNPKNKELKGLAAILKDEAIISIASDTLSNIIYFSTKDALYALTNSTLIRLTDNLGGVLRYFDNGLVVFNPEKKFIVRIAGIGNTIKSEMHPLKPATGNKHTPETFTNATIVGMAGAKLSDDLIIKLIDKSDVNFNLSVDSMIFLSNQNVSSKIIMAMKKAQKRKTINSSNGNSKQ